jgi:hypothetical protein
MILFKSPMDKTLQHYSTCIILQSHACGSYQGHFRKLRDIHHWKNSLKVPELKHMNMESKKQEQQKACQYKKCQLSNKAWMSNILVLLHNMLSDPQLVPT